MSNAERVHSCGISKALSSSHQSNKNEPDLKVETFWHAQRCQNASSNGKLPVLFHIHGGGFVTGFGGFYGPKFLMDECIVYVNNNYRLGALGNLKIKSKMGINLNVPFVEIYLFWN